MTAWYDGTHAQYTSIVACHCWLLRHADVLHAPWSTVNVMSIVKLVTVLKVTRPRYSIVSLYLYRLRTFCCDYKKPAKRIGVKLLPYIFKTLLDSSSFIWYLVINMVLNRFQWERTDRIVLLFLCVHCPANTKKRFHLSSQNLERYFVRWLKFKWKMSKDFSNLFPFHDDCIFSNGSCSCSLFSIGSAVCTKRQKFQIYNIRVHWHFIAVGIIYLWSCYSCLVVGLRVTTRARSLPSLTQTIANTIISYQKSMIC